MERLSGIDASFLYMETENVHLQIAFVMVCDGTELEGGCSYPHIVELLRAKTLNDSAFRRRLIRVPFDLSHPVWIDDPDYDIQRHVHRKILSIGKATERQLGRAIGDIISRPLPKDRPLWAAWVIEGLEQNRFAVMFKAHHAAMDGVAGTRLVRRLLDLQPASSRPQQTLRVAGETLPKPKQLIGNAWQVRRHQILSFAKLLGSTVRGAYRVFNQNPIEEGAQQPRFLSAPATHFNKRVGGNRDVDLVRLSLSQIKQVKNALGCTVNDVVLGICGGVLRKYLLRHHDLPKKSLTVMVPISVHKPQENHEIANHISSMWVSLGTHLDDPLERLQLIHSDTKRAKAELNAMGADLLQDWAEYSQGGVFNAVVRLYSQWGLADKVTPHNLIVSNVPGPRETLYFGSAKVDSMFILGPIMEAVGLNITLVSYGDTVGFSVHVDSDLVSDVEHISKLFIPELTQLLTLAKAENHSVNEGSEF